MFLWITPLSLPSFSSLSFYPILVFLFLFCVLSSVPLLRSLLFLSCFFLFTRAFYLHSLPSPCLRFSVCHMWCHLQWWWVWGDESQFPSSFFALLFRTPFSFSFTLSLSPVFLLSHSSSIVKISLKSCSFVNLYFHQKMSGLEKKESLVFFSKNPEGSEREKKGRKSLSKT